MDKVDIILPENLNRTNLKIQGDKLNIPELFELAVKKENKDKNNNHGFRDATFLEI